ncbi:MAG: hypothetical protein ABIG11_02010 [bacterium]
MNAENMLGTTAHLSRLLYVVYKSDERSGIAGVSCLCGKTYYVWGKRSLRKMDV